MTAERPPYLSALRTHQARATRHTIVAAATDLFIDQGYCATTIDAIAERAGVGRKTVFSSVGGKGALLKLAWDWAIAGDDEPVPMAERPAVQAMLAERDPYRLLRMWVDMALDVGTRVSPLGAVLFAAADVDADALALWQTVRRESLVGATAFAHHLAGVGGLRADVSIEQASDTCWALTNSQLLPLLLTGRGWSREEYGGWLMRVAAATLLEPAAGLPRAVSVLQVEHHPAQRSYVAVIDDRRVGQLAYELTDRLMVITRTQVDPDREDGPAAGALVRAALADVRSDGVRRVVALCPFALWWIGRHDDYAGCVYDPAAD